MNIGDNIRAARKSAGMKQKELAYAAGCAIGTIQQYERGLRMPRLEQLNGIANALGISVEELICGMPGTEPRKETLWEEVGNLCLEKAKTLMESEHTATLETAEIVKTLIDCASNCDLVILRWELQTT